MPESISIPLDLLTETRSALDAALAVASPSAEAYGEVVKVRAKLDEAIGGKSGILSDDKKQKGYHLLRRLDEMRREIKQEFGIEK
jgi:hypothetical protein